MDNNAIIELINDNIIFIDEYERLFVSGKFNESNKIFHDNIKKISDSIQIVINCYTIFDKNDESGHQKLWIGMLQNLVEAYKSDDVFYKYDVLCYDIKGGFYDFLNMIGAVSK